MITILYLIIFLLSSIQVNAEKLIIYTYDSFVSDWGPGPLIEKKFKEKFNTEIKFVAVDSAATLLSKIILEGSSTKADIVLGLDMNLFDAANKSNLFSSHTVKNVDKIINLPIKWNSEKFITILKIVLGIELVNMLHKIH